MRGGANRSSFRSRRRLASSSSLSKLDHELVRATIRNVVPPQLAVSELDGDGGLHRLVLAAEALHPSARPRQGTAGHYGEQATLDERARMHRDASVCVFAVRLSPARSV